MPCSEVLYTDVVDWIMMSHEARIAAAMKSAHRGTLVLTRDNDLHATHDPGRSELGKAGNPVWGTSKLAAATQHFGIRRPAPETEDRPFTHSAY